MQGIEVNTDLERKETGEGKERGVEIEIKRRERCRELTLGEEDDKEGVGAEEEGEDAEEGDGQPRTGATTYFPSFRPQPEHHLEEEPCYCYSGHTYLSNHSPVAVVVGRWEDR